MPMAIWATSLVSHPNLGAQSQNCMKHLRDMQCKAELKENADGCESALRDRVPTIFHWQWNIKVCPEEMCFNSDHIVLCAARKNSIVILYLWISMICLSVCCRRNQSANFNKVVCSQLFHSCNFIKYDLHHVIIVKSVNKTFYDWSKWNSKCCWTWVWINPWWFIIYKTTIDTHM